MRITALATHNAGGRLPRWLSVRHSLRTEAVAVLALYGLYELTPGLVVGDVPRLPDRAAAAGRHRYRRHRLERPRRPQSRSRQLALQPLRRRPQRAHRLRADRRRQPAPPRSPPARARAWSALPAVRAARGRRHRQPLLLRRRRRRTGRRGGRRGGRPTDTTRRSEPDQSASNPTGAPARVR
jgi:hypothetical protein